MATWLGSGLAVAQRAGSWAARTAAQPSPTTRAKIQHTSSPPLFVRHTYDGLIRQLIDRDPVGDWPRALDCVEVRRRASGG